MIDFEMADIKKENIELIKSNKQNLETIINLRKDKTTLIRLCIAELITILILDLIIFKLVILL